jgi:hypothetical protein
MGMEELPDFTEIKEIISTIRWRESGVSEILHNSSTDHVTIAKASSLAENLGKDLEQASSPHQLCLNSRT